jgi:hypothetical protein
MFHAPRTYNLEAVVGLLWTQPFLLLSIAAVTAPFWNKRRDPLLIWLTFSLLSTGILSFGGPLIVNGATMRYLLDIVPSLAILSAVGYWLVLEALADRPRVLHETRSMARIVVAAQCLLGFLLAFTGYYRHFQAFNPPLYHFLVSHFPVIPP